MSKEKGSGVVSRTLISTVIFLISASLGCTMLGGGTTSKNGSGDPKAMKGIPAERLCQMLAQPTFESRSQYDGAGCSGSTYFGARDTRTASYETDMRPSFSYAAMGEEGVIKKVTLTMSKRPDGGQFFLAQTDAIARAINDQPLPKELESAITGPLSTLGGDFTTTSQVGNAKVELVRSTTDSRFYLTFQF